MFGDRIFAGHLNDQQRRLMEDSPYVTQSNGMAPVGIALAEQRGQGSFM
jgi:hypothetical protein